MPLPTPQRLRQRGAGRATFAENPLAASTSVSVQRETFPWPHSQPLSSCPSAAATLSLLPGLQPARVLLPVSLLPWAWDAVPRAPGSLPTSFGAGASTCHLLGDALPLTGLSASPFPPFLPPYSQQLSLSKHTICFTHFPCLLFAPTHRERKLHEGRSFVCFVHFEPLTPRTVLKAKE